MHRFFKVIPRYFSLVNILSTFFLNFFGQPIKTHKKIPVISIVPKGYTLSGSLRYYRYLVIVSQSYISPFCFRLFRGFVGVKRAELLFVYGEYKLNLVGRNLFNYVSAYG